MWQNKVVAEQGIIIAISREIEHFLPWWWYNYKTTNDYPVTFVDLGISDYLKNWCKQHGHYVKLEVGPGMVKPKERICQKSQKRWEKEYGALCWKIRRYWFMKPTILKQTFYKKTLWLDLDCQVITDLSALFKYDVSKKVACALDNPKSRRKNIIYNSGVLLYEHGANYIDKWQAMCKEKNDQFLGDQNILSYLINKKEISVNKISYQWNVCYKHHDEKTKILHWRGTNAKIKLHKLVNNLYQSSFFKFLLK